ncbi:MAG: ATP-binding protein, partial [Deltaproteobacteria bacterium]|nr:ATP-binding protein [Deltaproteobacteria bacterium]
MDFINREVELAMLDKLYRSPGFQFVPIYGRRRIGKTRLVREFMAGKKAIYFLADSIPDSEQLKLLGRAVGEYFSDTILADAGFKNWYQFFAYLRDKHAGRLVLVVDEFPYLVNANQA